MQAYCANGRRPLPVQRARTHRSCLRCRSACATAPAMHATFAWKFPPTRKRGSLYPPLPPIIKHLLYALGPTACACTRVLPRAYAMRVPDNAQRLPAHAQAAEIRNCACGNTLVRISVRSDGSVRALARPPTALECAERASARRARVSLRALVRERPAGASLAHSGMSGLLRYARCAHSA
jgi:hypothetical protein